MTFLAGLIIGLFFGATLGFLLACILTVASRDDDARRRDPSDPYGISERMRSRARALERAGVQELRSNVVPLGHHRLGIDHPTKRGAARLTPPTP